jgi:hypothetical protein
VSTSYNIRDKTQIVNCTLLYWHFSEQFVDFSGVFLEDLRVIPTHLLQRHRRERRLRLLKLGRDVLLDRLRGVSLKLGWRNVFLVRERTGLLGWRLLILRLSRLLLKLLRWLACLDEGLEATDRCVPLTERF